MNSKLTILVILSLCACVSFSKLNILPTPREIKSGNETLTFKLKTVNYFISKDSKSYRNSDELRLEIPDFYDTFDTFINQRFYN